MLLIIINHVVEISSNSAHLTSYGQLQQRLQTFLDVKPGKSKASSDEKGTYTDALQGAFHHNKDTQYAQMCIYVYIIYIYISATYRTYVYNY